MLKNVANPSTDKWTTWLSSFFQYWPITKHLNILPGPWWNTLLFSMCQCTWKICQKTNYIEKWANNSFILFEILEKLSTANLQQSIYSNHFIIILAAITTHKS